MTDTATRVWRVVSIAGLCLAVALAIWLRSRQLTFQSLWWDEGGSFYHAHTSIAELTTTKDFRLDPHPPVYYLLLHWWQALTGTSVATGRMLSVVCGVLTVPLAFWVAWLSFGRGAAVITAFLVAINPALIFVQSGSENVQPHAMCGARVRARDQVSARRRRSQRIS